MKNSKRVREQAALICAVAASNPDLRCDYARTAHALEISRWGPEFDLAMDAWGRVCRELKPWDRTIVDAEAEALIRSGEL